MELVDIIWGENGREARKVWRKRDVEFGTPVSLDINVGIGAMVWSAEIGPVLV
jgi:hypothetical protein